MVSAGKTMIEVDSQAAEIIRLADARARACGETLGTYLQHNLPADVLSERPGISANQQAEAWNAFVRGMTAWSKANLPAGYVADDSRDSMYDDPH